MTYTDRWQLAQDIRERLGLLDQFTAEQVYAVTPTPRGRYEDIDDQELEEIQRAIWAALECGPWPWEATTLRYATFERFEIAMTLEDALSASHQGACDEEVAVLLSSQAISRQLDEIGPNAIRDELREEGAWDEEQLADDQANRERIVWIAAGNIREEAKPARGIAGGG